MTNYLKHVFALVMLLAYSGGSLAKQINEFTVPESTKYVYVDFWASWCAPCLESFPFMNKINRSYKEKGLAIVAVNVDENSSDATRFLNRLKQKNTFAIAHDPKGELAKKYRVKVMPSSYLLDKFGRVIAKFYGFNQKEKSKIIKTLNKFLR